MLTQAKQRRSIFFILTAAFQVRSYLCTPNFQRLVRIKDELGIDLVFMANMSTIKPFLERHGCHYEPLIPISDSWRERKAFEIRENLTHKIAAFRFNAMHGFSKQRRKQRISAEMRRQYKHVIKRRDVVHNYYGFPFPRSRSLLNLTLKLNNSRLMVSNRKVAAYFDRHNPSLVVIGATQNPYVSSYVHYAHDRGVPLIGGVGSWDHPTMDGPAAKGVKEYWVWNRTMLEEMVTYHDLSPEEASDIPQTPKSLEESLDCLSNDHDFLLKGDVFTPDVIDTWIEYKMENEVNALKMRPHPYEFAMYYDI